MQLTLWAAFGNYHLTDPGQEPLCPHDQPSHARLDFDDLESAARMVKRLMEEATAAQRLRGLAAGAGLSPVASGAGGEQLARELAYLLLTRRLVLVECRPPPAPQVPQQGQAPPPPAGGGGRQTATQHWIEFKVVEEESQRFIENVTLELVLPNRQEATHTTQGDTLHIRLNQSGAARLLKMEHADYWEAV